MLKLDVLRRQHRAIRVLLQALRTTRVDTPDGRSLLHLARNAILNHLHEEDLEFYPLLTRNAAASALADAYFCEMRDVSRRTIAFFDACAGDGGADAFAAGFAAIHRLLLQRMEREELHLYPACGGLLAAASPGETTPSIDLRG
ncbi:hemerythrin HHE cation binding domain protein [Mizugakiibacter sediminis]|uniref:Hemerythrin n=1 Tax=Mizugakiibacter sediminis TaxID=1475481 RepID=A0A0K8QJ95_9GAMM|nr:hemerythrin domain-containing protein [Mizugakiibacter sediminis]GAP64899.1 hemerythrin HHE cation binding domain protein [Mizugakiibacter sediminis]